MVIFYDLNSWARRFCDHEQVVRMKPLSVLQNFFSETETLRPVILDGSWWFYDLNKSPKRRIESQINNT